MAFTSKCVCRHREVFLQYQRLLLEMHLIDFDDMLIYVTPGSQLMPVHGPMQAMPASLGMQWLLHTSPSILGRQAAGQACFPILDGVPAHFGDAVGRLKLLQPTYCRHHPAIICDIDYGFLQAIKLLQDVPAVREQMQAETQYLLMDEFQDINPLQVCL